MKHLSDNQLDFYERLIKVSGAVATTIVIPIVDELREQLSENARLRKAIEDAPIGDQCDGMQCIRIFEEWQAKALGDHNGTI